MGKKQDEYKVKFNGKYNKHIKLIIAILTTIGLIGTGAEQSGFFNIEPEPTSEPCPYNNVEMGDVKVDLNIHGVK